MTHAYATDHGVFEYGKPRCYVVCITPFDEHGRIDEGAYRAHLDRMADAGLGLYVAGPGGEAFALDHDERRQVLEIAVDQLKGRAPVRAMGTEPRSAREMIAFAELAAEAGVDAVQIYSHDQGHGLKPQPRELERYYDDVLAAVDLPVVLSSHHLSGYLQPLELWDQVLDRYPQVIGLNVSAPDVNYLTRAIDRFADRVEVHAGGIQQTLGAMALGAHGYLSVQANLIARTSQAVVDRFVAGDLGGVNRAFAKVLRVLEREDGLGIARGTKEGLRQLGLPGGLVRPPMMPVTPEQSAQVAAMLAELDIAADEIG